MIQPEAIERCQKRWERYKNRIDGVFTDEFSHEEATDHAKSLFKAYIPWTWGYLARTAYNFCGSLQNKHCMISGLMLAIVNTRYDHFVREIIRYGLYKLTFALNNEITQEVQRATYFFIGLYRFKLVNTTLIVQIISRFLEQKNLYLQNVIDILWKCAPIISEDKPDYLQLIFQELMMVTSDSYTRQIQRLSIWIRDEWVNNFSKERLTYSRIPYRFQILEDDDYKTHDDITLEDAPDEDTTADIVQMHSPMWFDQIHAELKEQIKSVFPDDEEEEEESLEVAEANQGSLPVNPESLQDAKEVINAEREKAAEMEFTQTAYLTINQSATAAEIAHRLVKLAEESDPKYIPVMINLCVDYVKHSRVFEKSMAITMKMLISTNPDWLSFLEAAFTRCYNTVSDMQSTMIDNITAYFAYLIADQVVPWTVLDSVRLEFDPSKTHSRVFINKLMTALAAAHSHPNVPVNTGPDAPPGAANQHWLARLLVTPEVEPHVSNIFRVDGLQSAQLTLQFFRAIGLEFLCDGVKVALSNMMAEELAKQNEMAKPLRKFEQVGVIPNSDSDSSDSRSDSSSDSEAERRHRRRRHRHHHRHHRK